MTLVRVPDPRRGINAFATPDWWAGQATDRVSRDGGGATIVATVDDVADQDDVTLLVVEPIGSFLAEPSLAALDAWVADVRDLAGVVPGPVRLAVSLDPVTSLDQLETLARGHRWPPFDVAAAARHDQHEPIPAPAVPGGLEVIREYADALVAQVEVLLPPSWATAADGVADAAACVVRALDADPDLDDVTARALRDASRQALADLEADGITLSGPRDALLWPVPAGGGGIPLDVAADAAVEVMLAQFERPAEGVR